MKELNKYELDLETVPDGYHDLESIPALTRDNLRACIDKINELVLASNALAARLGVTEEK